MSLQPIKPASSSQKQIKMFFDEIQEISDPA